MKMSPQLHHFSIIWWVENIKTCSAKVVLQNNLQRHSCLSKSLEGKCKEIYAYSRIFEDFIALPHYGAMFQVLYFQNS